VLHFHVGNVWCRISSPIRRCVTSTQASEVHPSRPRVVGREGAGGPARVVTAFSCYTSSAR
jgi:hypothetical protein